MQLAEFFDQQFAGDQFQFEIKRALHEDLYGFLRGHGILLPWEWVLGSSAVTFAYLIGVVLVKLDWGNERTGEGLPKKKAALALAVFLLIDTIEKIQHNSFYNYIVSGWE